MTLWPVSLWQILLTWLPFFAIYVVVAAVAMARVHPGKRVRIRFKRPRLTNARTGLEWKIPGIVIGLIWSALITYFPIQFLGFFGVNVHWFVIGVDFVQKGCLRYPTRTSWSDLIVTGLLWLAMVFAGALLAAWWHNRRLPAPSAPEAPEPDTPPAE